MADSILEKIALNVVATVEDVTGIAAVVRPTAWNTYEPKDKVAVIEQEAAEPPIEITGSPIALEYRQPFAIHLFRVVSEESSTPLDLAFNAIAALVQQAMAADVTRGGLAHDTQFGAVAYFRDEAASLAEAVVEILVDYRVSKGDPFTMRA